MKELISITAVSSISPIGNTYDSIWNNYLNNHHFITKNDTDLVAELSQESKQSIENLRQENSKYKTLDNSVLYAMYASRLAIKNANWKASDNFGINIGSSRGATSLFESYYQDFLNSDQAKTLSSPTTTLGNISSWVAHDLQTNGPEISHSITCSTALHAMLNGIAWINSGMSDTFLVGGSEAPLTPFTIAQMRALKIYSNSDISRTSMSEIKYPCRALDFKKTKNTMVLGEGASVACLEKDYLKTLWLLL